MTAWLLEAQLSFMQFFDFQNGQATTAYGVSGAYVDERAGLLHLNLWVPAELGQPIADGCRDMGLDAGMSDWNPNEPNPAFLTAKNLGQRFTPSVGCLQVMVPYPVTEQMWTALAVVGLSITGLGVLANESIALPADFGDEPRIQTSV